MTSAVTLLINSVKCNLYGHNWPGAPYKHKPGLMNRVKVDGHMSHLGYAKSSAAQTQMKYTIPAVFESHDPHMWGTPL